MLAVVFGLRLSCFVCVSVACADQQRTGGGSSEVPPALRAGCKRHHCMIPADISHVSVFNWSLQILSPPCSSFQESGAKKLNMTSKSHLHLHQTVWAKKQKKTLGIITKTCIATGTHLSKWNLANSLTLASDCERKKYRKWPLAKPPKLASDCLSKDTENDTWQSHLHLHLTCVSNPPPTPPSKKKRRQGHLHLLQNVWVKNRKQHYSRSPTLASDCASEETENDTVQGHLLCEQRNRKWHLAKSFTLASDGLYEQGNRKQLVAVTYTCTRM